MIFFDFSLPLTLLVQFNDNYQLHGLGSSVNFLGVSQDGNYHKDVLKARHDFFHIRHALSHPKSSMFSLTVQQKTPCTLPSDHIALVGSAIANAETRCAEAQSTIATSVKLFILS